MAFEGPLLRWVATHCKHHQHSDDDEDPHSPHNSGTGVLAVLMGCWHAHIGWMFKSHGLGLQRYIRDFKNDRVIRGVSRLFAFWVMLGLVIPAVAGGLITGSWTGLLLGFLWGGLVRMFLIHHVTWSINSVCHLWGTRPFDGGDHSRNNFVFGVLGMGEGWHNNHHAFPSSARYGLRWWQLDLGFWVIHAMSWLGLAWDVRVPARESILQRSLRARRNRQ